MVVGASRGQPASDGQCERYGLLEGELSKMPQQRLEAHPGDVLQGQKHRFRRVLDVVHDDDVRVAELGSGHHEGSNGPAILQA